MLARRWGMVMVVLASVAAALPASADAQSPEPVRVLVFSKPYGFSHTDSIDKGAAWLRTLDGQGFAVVNTTDPAQLSAANLSGYDVLVWNNSTGEVPLDAAGKRALLDWIRAGHGYVGIHSAGDSNYTWPQFADVQGGLFFMHYYEFGGIGYEPVSMKVVQEDPANALMDGVPADWAVKDEIYKWHADPRPDVHVLQSMDNTSIAEGATYHWHSPLTWCRPFGTGRAWYTNFAHGGWEWSEPVFTKMVRNGLLYAGGRLQADCSVPADPYTGVKAADRMLAAWADQIMGATPTVSTYSGGMSALTDITTGTSVTWRGVDLTGVTNIDVFATAQKISRVGSTQLPQQRVTRASGGTVEIHLDSVTGPTIGTVSIPPLPALTEHLTLPDQLAPVSPTLAATSWSKLTPTDFRSQTGVHDLVLTFPGAGGAPGATDVGSLAWIHLVK